MRVTVLTDHDLYMRGAETLLASWDAIAVGSRGAAVLRLSGVAAGVFPHGPERGVYNNALLDRDLGPFERVKAVDLMKAAYASAGVGRFAPWVPESDEPMGDELEPRGSAWETPRRAVGMVWTAVLPPRPQLPIAAAAWS